MISNMRLLILTLLTFGIFPLTSAASEQESLLNYFSEVELRIDTNIYKYTTDKIYVENEWKTSFEYQEINPVVEFGLFPGVENGKTIPLSLMPTNEYQIIDSLTLRVDGYYHCKVQFQDLSQASLLNL